MLSVGWNGVRHFQAGDRSSGGPSMLRQVPHCLCLLWAVPILPKSPQLCRLIPPTAVPRMCRQPLGQHGSCVVLRGGLTSVTAPRNSSSNGRALQMDKQSCMEVFCIPAWLSLPVWLMFPLYGKSFLDELE